MIDKMWSDWQNRLPENFYAFGGGSVGAHSQPGLYAQFPTGGPPFLNVSNGCGSFYVYSFAHSNPLQPGMSMPTDGILRNFTIYDVFDTKSDDLCYVYE